MSFHLAAENEILKSKLKGTIKFKDAERIPYHQERNHQAKENLLLFPTQNNDPEKRDGEIACRSWLGGMLKYYYRKAA